MITIVAAVALMRVGQGLALLSSHAAVVAVTSCVLLHFALPFQPSYPLLFGNDCPQCNVNFCLGKMGAGEKEISFG